MIPHVYHLQILKDEDGLDFALIGSENGLDLLSYSSKIHAWHKRHLGDGDTTDFDPKKLPSSFKGVGSVQQGFIKNEQYPSIVTIEAMHGHITALYTPHRHDTSPMVSPLAKHAQRCCFCPAVCCLLLLLLLLLQHLML